LVGGQVLTQLDWPAGQKPTVRALHQFFQSIERLCDFSPPELLDSNHEGQSLLRLALQLCIDSKRPRQARLIYLPSPLEHPLGGVPEVGLQFLSESMERRGWHCSRMELRAEDIERRLPELLGAALIGIGVYVHNRPQAQELVRCLRGAGYEGLIVLGGPETRDIDGLMDDFEGWDAILRGEAEDLLPELAELLCELKADPSQAQRERLWERAKGWEGLAIQAGDELWLCETSSRLKASAIQCPWPFRWRLERKLLAEPATLKMNFTRGCPYLCSFCPNHQGRNFRSAYAEGIVAFMARALAEGLEWSESLKQRLAPALFPTEHAALDLDLDLAMSLALLDLGGMSRRLDRAEAALAEWIAVPIADWDQRIELELGPVLDLEPLHSASARLKAQRRWSRLALLVLAERQRARRSATPGSPPELEGFSARPFIVETSEDNTLVNRAEIRAVLERRRALGFSSELIFNPGQNTVRDFFDGRGRLDEAWIDALVQDNPMAIALGTDGASNAVLRQNRKPAYQIEDVLALNRALGQRTVRVANNVILLSPETNAREAIEAFVLYLLLPIPWRDYGSACNLRVIKEDTSLARDEGLLFSPEDSSWDEPLRDAETAALLARWSLDSTISNNALRQRIRDLLALDALAKRELHTVIESWRRGVDGDRELQALAALIDERCGEAAEHETLLEAVLALERWRNEVGLVDGLCKQTFRESLALTRAAASSL
jgi:hypothetical protein